MENINTENETIIIEPTEEPTFEKKETWIAKSKAFMRKNGKYVAMGAVALVGTAVLAYNKGKSGTNYDGYYTHPDQPDILIEADEDGTYSIHQIGPTEDVEEVEVEVVDETIVDTED